MNCPKCRKAQMRSEVHGGVQIERCPVCRGVFLDKGEMDRLLELNLGGSADTLEAASGHDPDGLEAQCPRCAQKMMRLEGPGDIAFDWCDSCEAVFLDRGELASLQLFQGEEEDI